MLTLKTLKTKVIPFPLSLNKKNITRRNLLLLCSLVFFSLSVVSCNKEHDLPKLEKESTPTVLNLNSAEEEPLLSRGRSLWMDKCRQQFQTKDQKAIRAARAANNEALKEQDAQGVAEDYLEDFFILTSTNGLFTGKQRVEEIYQLVFDTREDVLFVRTPTAITVNNDWNMASENGNWIGTWIVDSEDIEVGGDYYAKWHKIDGVWKMRCEVYTQFDCEGEVVCNNKPSLQ